MAKLISSCEECFSCKTRVFRDFKEFMDFVIKKGLKTPQKTINEIERIIRNKGEIRVYWCSDRQRGPYFRISEIPNKSCKKIFKNE